MDASLHPDDFARAMCDHWTTTLGNVASPAFMDLWRILARTFNDAIAANASDNPDKGLWRVLQPPTGSGKTQGARIYCAMTAVANVTRAPADRVGVLIVSREIAEADKLAAEINESVAKMLGGGSAPRVAVARHGGSTGRVTSEDMRAADVLIITHAAYVRALDMLQRDAAERWESLVTWEHGKRRLTIVDETITNIVETYQLNVETVKRALAFIPESIRRDFKMQMDYLEKMLVVLRGIGERAAKEAEPGDRIVWSKDKALHRDQWEGLTPGMDMSGLRTAVSKLSGYIEADDADEDQANTRTSVAALVDNTLRSVQAVYSRWAWYARKGNVDTFNGSRLLLPDDFPAPVVLDATASQDVLWSLLGDRVTRPVVPTNARSYANVTLHLARVNRGLGKVSMREHGKRRLARLMAHLNERLAGRQRKTLLVLHKAVEHLAADAETTFGELRVAHWGSIDGKNEWGDCDTAVIFGLSHRDRIWANNLYMAVRGLQTNEWLQGNAELRNEMERRQLTVSIVQAINRIRCRRVIDDRGNCPDTEVFLFLPAGERGDNLLAGIVAEMPGIAVSQWDFDLDGPHVALRRGSSHEGVFKLMENAPAGEVPFRTIEREFSLSAEAAKSLRATLRDPSSELAKRLAAVGVSYVKVGARRGARSFLVKRAA